MTFTEILIISAAILILVDIFFASDIPTHIAYFLITLATINNINDFLIYKVLYGIIILFMLVIFHYVVWRGLLEKMNDRFISPRRHIGSHERLIGKTGMIKNIDDKLVIVVGDEVFQFESEIPVTAGELHVIKNIHSSTLVI